MLPYVRDATEAGLTGRLQSDLTEEAWSRQAAELERAHTYLRRSYQVKVLASATNALLAGTNARDRPGVVAHAGGGAGTQYNFQVVDDQGRSMQSLPAADRIDGRLLNPEIIFIVPTNYTFTLAADAGAGQALTDLDATALPREAGSRGYRAVCGRGSAPGGGTDLSGTEGCINITIVALVAPTGVSPIVFYIPQNPLLALGMGELRLNVT